ncbi:putative outer membrane protein precursor [Bradyrhizobium sp. ORS 375]|uniref:outer membrane protein n=1 Tax=Bradyrhizobium sp. (strain ORS 375) TaxID=566679 RepID=UPI00024080DF|nr:outer membrane protein [Bradyrhizobium sp. ORS 375]CCD96856.1 putative outer membrane protein precursor [Bradyrhizobium sp. ORS 375]
MKTLASAVTLLIASSLGAFAADMPVRYAKAPPPAAIYNWTGGYFGGNVGYGWGRSNLGTTLDQTSSWAVEAVAFQNQFVAISNNRLNPSGVVGGLQAGYNWQTGPSVFGIEADFNGSGMNKRVVYTAANPPTTRTFNESIRNDWFMTVRGRAGYAIDTTLLYVTGGLAVGNVKGSWDLTSGNGYAKTASVDQTRVGWTIGAGVEHAFAPNWTVKFEYLYTDLGSVNYTSAYVPGSTFAPPGSNYVERLSQDFTFHTARVGVNYKFGGPVVARY